MKRRGFAIAVALWAMALLAVVLASVQWAATRRAMEGREALARVRATWAARAGVEAVIARLQEEAGAATPLGSRSLLSSLAQDASGRLSNASWRTEHDDAEFGATLGPADVDARLNVNTLTFDDLMLLPDMTEDLAEAILDWIDADDETRTQGAELGDYAGLAVPYVPRNGPIVDLRELELVRGVRPEYVRGEDWNQNGVLDPEENDGDASFPPDDADGRLDAGWSGIIGVGGTAPQAGLAESGEERVDLTQASASDVQQALGVDSTQAEVILAQAQESDASLADFLETPLSTLATRLGLSGPGTRVTDLTNEQLTLLLAESVIPGDSAGFRAGRLNLNTAAAETLEYVAALDPTLRDALVLYRDQRAGDITSLVDLFEVPQVDRATLAELAGYLEVRTTALRVSVRGRDEASGLVVEMVAEVDRSTDPVSIRSLTVR